MALLSDSNMSKEVRYPIHPHMHEENPHLSVVVFVRLYTLHVWWSQRGGRELRGDVILSAPHVENK